MASTIAAKIKALQQLPVNKLREEYHRVYGEATTAANKGFLIKKIAWKIQELEFGGITEEVTQKAWEMVEGLNLPGRIPSIKLREKCTGSVQFPSQDKRLPLPGTIITREYKGMRIEVEVTEEGFVYAGNKYHSLSAVAKAVTGSHWNGFVFFHL
jgi:hypothetical protein